jgi:hypothetical protein
VRSIITIQYIYTAPGLSRASEMIGNSRLLISVHVRTKANIPAQKPPSITVAGKPIEGKKKRIQVDRKERRLSPTITEPPVFLPFWSMQRYNCKLTRAMGVYGI